MKLPHRCPDDFLSRSGYACTSRSSDPRRAARRKAFFAIVLSLAFLGAGRAHVSFAAVMTVGGLQRATSVLPHLFYLPDPDASLNIGEAASPASADRFLPLAEGIPYSYNGPIWLRLLLLKAEQTPSAEEDDRILLDLGRGTAGTSSLFFPREGAPGGETPLWQLDNSSSRPVFSLPVPGMTPVTVYIRLDAPPALWFNPTLQAASFYRPPMLPMDLVLPALLAAALLMSLLRAQREKTQWRLWAALVTGAALIQAFFPVTALPPGPITPGKLSGLLTPGFMLMLLPHVGRHLLQTPRTAPGIDAFLRLAPLLGAALALAPLIPGLHWLARYLVLWPLMLLPLLPPAIRCLSRRIPGALAFFTACFAPVLGLAASLLELANATPFQLGTSGHIWGMTLGCLALALASPVRGSTREEETPDAVRSEFSGLPIWEGEPRPDSFGHQSTPPETEFRDLDFAGQPAAGSQNLEHDSVTLHETPVASGSFAPAAGGPLPHAQTRPAESEAPLQTDQDNKPSLPLDILPAATGEEPEPCIYSDAPYAAFQASFAEQPTPDSRFPLAPCPLTEESVQNPPAQPIRHASPMPGQNMPEPPATEQFPEQKESPDIPGNAIERFAPENEFTPLESISPAVDNERLFDLSRLLREAYAAVAAMAEKKGLGLSWHVSPYIDQYYEGDGELLGEALNLLLRDAVRTIGQGSIELTVRGLPGNANPGHLVFALSVRSGGTAVRPGDMTAIGRAWALADRYGGFFSLDHNQDGAMNVVFSVQFAVLDREANLHAGQSGPLESNAPAPLSDPLPEESARMLEKTPFISSVSDDTLLSSAAEQGDAVSDTEQTQEQSLWVRDRIILVDMAAGNRRLRAQHLSRLSRPLLEADSVGAALSLYRRNPSGLMIFDADMPETDIAAGIAELRALEGTRSLPHAAVLALTAHDLQSERMLAAGCDAALIKPFSDEQLQERVLRLVPPQDGSALQPEPNAPEEPGQEQAGPPPAAPDAAQALLSDAELVALGLSAADVLPGSSNAAPPVWPDSAADPAGKTESPETPSASENTAPEHAAAPLESAQADSPEKIRMPGDPSDKEHAAPENPARTLPLLDMIIQEEDAEEAESAAGRLPAEPVVSEDAAQPAAAPEETLDAKEGRTPLARASEPPEPRAFPKPPPPSPVKVSVRRKPAARVSPQEQAQNKIPLPGLSDNVNADMLPFVPGLIYELGDAVADALRGREQKGCLLVQEAMERLAGKAEAFGLEGLERVARCVERAAQADDNEAVGDLLNELADLTERYKQALRLCHRDSL